MELWDFLQDFSLNIIVQLLFNEKGQAKIVEPRDFLYDFSLDNIVQLLFYKKGQSKTCYLTKKTTQNL